MKIYYAIALTLFLGSCKEVDLPTPESENIVGDWEWIASSGGIAGSFISADNVDYTKQLIFKDNGKYRKCTDNKKGSRGDFEIIIKENERYELTLDNEDLFGTLSLSFNGQDTINLYPTNCSDCFADTYVRK
jgi:hypothetical protein